ncbi:MAG TPA: sigma-54-dependent Fis family transcriptional regulator [Rhodospirillaceae bacterium]|nr:sigma-54-dependent Fis family transcriptional regulator [Alphaproteobacteria bacterium]HBH26088.1 sigma-54-dependent Fis family transcriptional regulator [Rhodospirillaceae bacterium]
MRLMLIGRLAGPIADAGRLALARGAKVAQAESPEQALAALRAGKGADAIFVEVGRCDIAALIAALEAERFVVPVIACGVDTTAEQAAQAIEQGARDFLPLPPDADLIAAILEDASGEGEARSMIASAPAMQAAVALAARVAPSAATVLITGESGTGKEVMARFLHKKSKRSDGAFIAINCAAIPEALLESELFGHEKGAFTGAAARRLGKFEEAHGGTILLDEVSEMAPTLQAKLLRVLQEREVVRVGSNAPVKVDVRILATSNRDMPAFVAEGHFRADLYYRLNVITLDLPPLRERVQDIPALAAHFAAHYAEINGLPTRVLSGAALRMLQAHPWPGNVRELENAVHRAVLVADGDDIGPEAILLDAGLGPQGEREAAAAKILGISIRALREKLNNAAA